MGNNHETLTKFITKFEELFFKLRDEFVQTFVIVTHNEKLANMTDLKLSIADGNLVPTLD